MSIVRQLVLIAGSASILIVFLTALSNFASRRSWSPELKRKCVHLSVGLYALSFPFIFDDVWPVLVLTGIGVAAVLILRLPLLAGWSLASALHDVGRKSYGDVMLPASVGLMSILSGNKPSLFILPIAVMVLSDSAAALVGMHYGRRFFPVGSGSKSLEGVMAFFVVTSLIAYPLLLAMTPMNPVDAVLFSIFIAGFGAVIEANSSNGLDNLFVPLGVYLVLSGFNATLPAAGLLGVLTARRFWPHIAGRHAPKSPALTFGASK